MGLGVAVLPRRCALSGDGARPSSAMQVPELSSPRTVRLVFRKGAGVQRARPPHSSSSRRAARESNRNRVQRVRRGYSPGSSRVHRFQPVEVAEGAPRRLRPPRTGRAAGRSRPTCRRGTTRGPPAAARSEKSCLPSATGIAIEIERQPRSRAPARPAPSSAPSRRARRVTHGMPSATELPKKISENDSPTTARIPRRRIACGACSRDEPQPKFAFTSRIVAPAYAGSATG